MVPGVVDNDPQAYLPGDRRRALAEGRELPEHATGAALFADISGFTALGDALAAQVGPKRGAEELNDLVNSVFEPLLTTLDRYGGDVIYFSGDAVTAWIEGDDGRLAVACALDMQQVMGRIRDDGRSRLALKVAVAVGPARRFVVGDPDIQLIDVLAGPITDRLAVAEHAAGSGEVVVGPDVVESIGPLLRFGARPGVVTGMGERVAPPAPRPAPPGLPDDVVRPWVLPRVYERITASGAGLYAELRPGAPLFMRFDGIDYEHDPGAGACLDSLVRTTQRIVGDHGGAVVQLTIGDKGAYLYAAFGALVAHGDDAPRACSCALELRAAAAGLGLSGVAIGITAGGLFTGTYGHPDRRAFCCFGDAVNLAARLMTAAPAGGILASGAVRRGADGFSWGEPVSITAKGKALPVSASALLGHDESARAHHATELSPLLGRDADLAALRAQGAQAIAGRGRTVLLTGGAGVGKTRLLREAASWLAEQGVQVWWGSARTFGVRPAYGAWRELVRQAWSVPADASRDAVVERLSDVLTAVDTALLERLPLLGHVVGVDLPDTPLTATFDAKLRKTSLESLMAGVIEATSARAPLALVLDAAETMDELSWDMVEVLRRSIARLPVLLVVARRPEEPGRAADHGTEIELADLGGDDARRLVAHRLAAGGMPAPADGLIDRLTALAGGNPNHLEELADHVLEGGADDELPTNLHSLHLARFDRLAEKPRTTLKVASVVGARFTTAAVAGTYPDLGAENEVARHAATLADAALVVPEADDFSFRNAMVQQAAYETLTFAMRGSMHDRVLSWLERSATGTVDSSLDVLAFHAVRGTDAAKRLDYLVRAGGAAQARYANEAAVDYYRAGLALAEGSQRVDLHRRLGKVLELTGRWPDADDAYRQAIALCVESGDDAGRARAETDLAEVLRKQSRYDEAGRLLDSSYDTFVRAGDTDGRASVLHLRGTIASQQAQYDAARASYHQSLQLRRELDDQPKIGALLSNLAVVAEQLEDYAAARQLNEQALAVREEVGDPWAIAVSRNNLGMVALLQDDHARANEHIAEAIRLSEKVGDRWLAAVGHHNNAIALRGLARYDEAGAEFGVALREYVDHDDRWSIALLVEDLVPFATATGQPDGARRLMAVADALRAELEVPRPPSVTSALESALASVPELTVGPGPDLRTDEVAALITALIS